MTATRYEVVEVVHGEMTAHSFKTFDNAKHEAEKGARLFGSYLAYIYKVTYMLNENNQLKVSRQLINMYSK